jgi:hypothetical protein
LSVVVFNIIYFCYPFFFGVIKIQYTCKLKNSKNLIFILFHQFLFVTSKAFMKSFLILNNIHFIIKTKNMKKNSFICGNQLCILMNHKRKHYICNLCQSNIRVDKDNTTILEQYKKFLNLMCLKRKVFNLVKQLSLLLCNTHKLESTIVFDESFSIIWWK